jgi:hypothetical protein
MNRPPDVELVLRAYLADTGDRAPDRVLEDVGARIARQPRRAWRLRGRPFMNTYAKLGLAAAALLLVVVAGYWILPRNGPAAPNAMPTGRITASPAALATLRRLPDGRVAAGEYAMRAVAGDSMTFVATAPQGWTGLGGFFLSAPVGSHAPNGVAISVSHDPAITPLPCGGAGPTPGPRSSADPIDRLIADITARADLEVSGVIDTELAGYTGKRLDVQFPASLACPNQYLFAEPKGLYANGTANRWRLWLLDVGGDTAVVVLLDFAGTSAADRATAEGIVSSIRINP